nr:MAG TPA: hypothetical protein [Caudoviricetes sp.]
MKTSLCWSLESSSLSSTNSAHRKVPRWVNKP